jgi:hypothetical protein
VLRPLGQLKLISGHLQAGPVATPYFGQAPAEPQHPENAIGVIRSSHGTPSCPNAPPAVKCLPPKSGPAAGARPNMLQDNVLHGGAKVINSGRKNAQVSC